MEKEFLICQNWPCDGRRCKVKDEKVVPSDDVGTQSRRTLLCFGVQWHSDLGFINHPTSNTRFGPDPAFQLSQKEERDTGKRKDRERGREGGGERRAEAV